MKRVTRAAILIGAPGPKHNFLRGVSHDLVHMRDFLMSPNGGGWFGEEIYSLYNADLEDTHYMIKHVYADYVLIFFSGHGSTCIYTKRRILSLQDRAISDQFLLKNSSQKINVIADSCRTYLGPSIGVIPPQYGDPFTGYDGEKLSRKAFNHFIIHSQPGKRILHSTLEGQPSYDSSTGGLFTKALLSVSNKFVSRDHMVYPLHLEDLATHVPSDLSKRKIYQVPEVTYNAGQLSVPFALALPKKNLQQNTTYYSHRRYRSPLNNIALF